MAIFKKIFGIDGDNGKLCEARFPETVSDVDSDVDGCSSIDDSSSKIDVEHGIIDWLTGLRLVPMLKETDNNNKKQ